MQATAIASSLAEGLGDTPEVFGVIHGDVIPDNILVAEDGNVRFIDFAQLAVWAHTSGTSESRCTTTPTRTRPSAERSWRGIA